MFIFLALFIIPVIGAFNPLVPTNGYTYIIEANRELAWPSCAYRFLSYSSSCDKVDLWNGAGSNQHWKFISTGDSDGSFYLQATCGAYLSYTSICNDKSTVDLWSQAGANQKFRFVVGDNTQFQYYIEAVGRNECAYRYVSFPDSCTTNTADKINFSKDTGADQRFRLFPVSSVNPIKHIAASTFVCPDPYVWHPTTTNDYRIQCTGGGLHLGSTPDIDQVPFSYLGDCLGGETAAWAVETAEDSRWAPENYESPDGHYNYLFFSDSQSNDNGNHRIGYVVSERGPHIQQYNDYPSQKPLNLGQTPGGDIDSTIFTDPDHPEHTYLIWKTDDNSVGMTFTRIWIQPITLLNGTVSLLDQPKIILNSTGIWWIDSWVSPGGSLIEGPELIKASNGYYYLFFAAGRFCQDTYTEGVARSKSLYGPYEKRLSPLLSNGIVGVGQLQHQKKQDNRVWEQLVGPGHASIVTINNKKNENEVVEYRIVYHASVGQNCNRYAFVNQLKIGSDDWPYVDF